jgi:hypothetical protein
MQKRCGYWQPLAGSVLVNAQSCALPKQRAGDPSLCIVYHTQSTYATTGGGAAASWVAKASIRWTNTMEFMATVDFYIHNHEC